MEKKEENSNLEFAMLKCLYDIIQKGMYKTWFLQIVVFSNQ